MRLGVASVTWKNKFYDSLLSASASVSNDCILFSCGDFSGHVVLVVAGCEGSYGAFGFGHRNTKGERVLEYP